jgi:hypothetical protein
MKRLLSLAFIYCFRKKCSSICLSPSSYHFSTSFSPTYYITATGTSSSSANRSTFGIAIKKRTTHLRGSTGINSFRVAILKGKMSDLDFGDDSFLMDFDPDAAIAASKNKLQQQGTETETTPVKSSPFGEDSGFSVGDKADHNQFIDPFINRHGKSTAFTPLQNPYTKRASANTRNDNDSNKRSYPNNSSPHNSDSKDVSEKHEDIGTNPSPPKRQIHHAPSTSENMVIPSSIQKALTKTLNKHFGHASFRAGQLSIIHSLLRKQDSAVFWSTGSGKSLCYQIPPLYSNKVALVVSPLISLMEDQVSKLNGIVSSDNDIRASGNARQNDVAIFLGSGQKDPTADQRALRGDYKLVYCTPEKLLSQNGWFLDQLGKLHETKTDVDGRGEGICLIAVDEVSNDLSIFLCRSI